MVKEMIWRFESKERIRDERPVEKGQGKETERMFKSEREVVTETERRGQHPVPPCLSFPFLFTR